MVRKTGSSETEAVTKRAPRGRADLIVFAGVASSIVFMGIAISRLRLDDIRTALATARVLPWVPLAVLSYVLGHLVRGVRCKMLVSREATIPVSVATNVVVLGYAVNNILPARLGEFARAAMLSERTGMPFAQSLSVTLLERLLDGLVLLAMLVVASVSSPVAGWIGSIVRIGEVVFGAATLGVVFAVVAPSALLRVASRMASALGPGSRARVVAIVSDATRGLSYVARPTDALRVLLLSIAVWLAEGGMYLALLPAFGIAPRFSVVLLVLSVTNLGILVPSSPGFIGAFHFFCMKALEATGVGSAVAFSYAVLVHLSFYVPVTAWGLLVLAGWGISVGEVVQRARSAERVASTDELLAEDDAPVRIAPRPEPQRFYVALVAAFVPEALDGASEGEHQAALRSAAIYLEGQIEALPGRLAWLFAVGIGGFRFLTRLRYARGYCDLAPDTRRRWTSAWAFGGLKLARQLFRAPRSLALVGYYESRGGVARHARRPESHLAVVHAP